MGRGNKKLRDRKKIIKSSTDSDIQHGSSVNIKWRQDVNIESEAKGVSLKYKEERASEYVYKCKQRNIAFSEGTSVRSGDACIDNSDADVSKGDTFITINDTRIVESDTAEIVNSSIAKGIVESDTTEVVNSGIASPKESPKGKTKGTKGCIVENANTDTASVVDLNTNFGNSDTPKGIVKIDTTEIRKSGIACTKERPKGKIKGTKGCKGIYANNDTASVVDLNTNFSNSDRTN